VFTADGDMRQALNNLQATNTGFGLVNQTTCSRYLLRIDSLRFSINAVTARGTLFAIVCEAPS